MSLVEEDGYPNEPLLLWVDDEPRNNYDLLRRAIQLGIHIKLIYSTKKALQWLHDRMSLCLFTSIDFLIRFASKVRIITDLERWEDGSYENRSGEKFVHAFRSSFPDLVDVPVLVCTRAVQETKFVTQFPSTYSTSNGHVVEKFIDTLGGAVKWESEQRFAL